MELLGGGFDFSARRLEPVGASSFRFLESLRDPVEGQHCLLFPVLPRGDVLLQQFLMSRKKVGDVGRGARRSRLMFATQLCEFGEKLPPLRADSLRQPVA